MKTTTLFTASDLNRLSQFIAWEEARLARRREEVAALRNKVEAAQVVDASEVPPDLVTMYSQIRVRDASGGRAYVTTVALPVVQESPGEDTMMRAQPALAMLGARVGDEVHWRAFGRLHRIRIEEILFQAESSARRARSEAGYFADRSHRPRARWSGARCAPGNPAPSHETHPARATADAGSLSGHASIAEL